MRKLLRRISYLMNQRREEDALAEEMAFHRAMKERECGDRRAFGSAALAHDQARDVWVWPWLQDLWQDARFATRVLAKEARFTLAVVLTLALAIAVNNTIFTIINTAVWRDVPFDEPDRLVSLATRDGRGRELGMSYLDFNEWRAATRTLTGLAASTGRAINIADDAQPPERVQGSYVSANTFGLLRVAPALGRDFVADDDRPGAPEVVILADGLWHRRYGGDRAILGRVIRVNDVPSTVIGVMPPNFRFPFADELWQPLALAPGVANSTRDARSLYVFGRLADNQTIDQGQADIDVIAARTGTEYPETNKEIRGRITQMGHVKPPTFMLMTLMGSVIFVLLIACANVANLLLARSASRTRETAIRASLGATRWRIVRQMLIECGLLTACAGLVGLALSVYGVKFLGVAFNRRQPGAPASAAVTPYWVDLSMNTPVFLFLGGVCLLATVLSGLPPAWCASRVDTNDALKEGGRGATSGIRARRWTSGFMVAQVALTLVLLTGAGLMLRGFIAHYVADRVIDTSGVITGRISLPLQKYATPERRRQFLELLHARLAARALPVTMASELPFGFVNATRQLVVEGQPERPGEELPTVSYIYADEGYFDVLGLQMIRGRSFIPADARIGEEGAIVNRRFAEMFFADRDVIGNRIRLMNRAATAAPSTWHTIVGVVPTLPPSVGSSQPEPAVFVPLLGEGTPSVVSLFVRSRSDVAAAVSVLRDDVRVLDSNLPLYWVQTLDQMFADVRFPLRLMGSWFGALALTALLLSTVGLYAVTGHAVGQRTQEIGVRMALGAGRREVVWMFLRTTIWQLAIGIGVGMAGVFFVGQLLQTWIAGISPRDPITVALVTVLLTTVAIVATLLPARRAACVDPLAALRVD